MSFARKRIVFDTSTLVACCLNPDRLPNQVLQITFREHLAFASQEALAELAQVLSRDKFDLWRPLEERLTFVAAYTSSVRLIEVAVVATECRDPKDNKFLSLAAAAKASWLVSSDDDLLSMGQYSGSQIISPRQLLALLDPLPQK